MPCTALALARKVKQDRVSFRGFVPRFRSMCPVPYVRVSSRQTLVVCRALAHCCRVFSPQWTVRCLSTVDVVSRRLTYLSSHVCRVRSAFCPSVAQGACAGRAAALSDRLLTNSLRWRGVGRGLCYDLRLYSNTDPKRKTIA